jgi:hypothetical protein
MRRLVINPPRGSRSGATKRIDGDPGEDLVVRPWVGICPVVELLVDPGEESDGAVVEGVGEGLGARGLEDVVALWESVNQILGISRIHIKTENRKFSIPRPVLLKIRRPFQPLLLKLRISRHSLLHRHARVLTYSRRVRSEKVDVACFAAPGEQGANGTSDDRAPITALSDVLRVPQLEHELMARLGILSNRKATLGNALAEAEVWERRRDDVEGRLGGVLLGFGEDGEELEGFDESSWPWLFLSKT